MSKAVVAHEKWINSIGDVPPTQELTAEIFNWIDEIIDRRATNDNEVVAIDQIVAEVTEEYPNIDEFALIHHVEGVLL